MSLKSAKKLKIFALGAVVILIASAIFYGFSLFSPPAPGAEAERFVIGLKTSEVEIIDSLYSQNYIKSPTAFEIVLSLREWHGKIKPGGYKISKGMTAFELAEVLVNHPYQKWVVLYEGLRKEEIVEIIGKQLGWQETQKNEFLNQAKEGYLFPDTYLFNLDYSGSEVANRMMNHFNEKTANLFKEAQKNNIRNDTLIVLASLIQREAASKEEMPLIAGIIWNRWLADMYFEIDASLQYALGKPDNWWPVVKKEDYKIDSPYNTYLHKGRPPSPICNPGLAAIEAVIFAEDSDYFYYLHDQNRQIHLAKTYEEHLENINHYIIFPAIKTFIADYLQTYKNITGGENYQEIKTFLTEDQLKYIAEKPASFQENFVVFDDYEILEVAEKRDNDENYVARVKLYRNGKVLKNPVTAEEITEIYIVKRNREFKISTWRFF